MKLRFERNEEQKERLEMAKANVGYSIFVFILFVLGGLFIDGPGLALVGAFVGGIISTIWLAFAYGLYEDSIRPVPGNQMHDDEQWPT